MHAAILSIGDELTLGQTVDTNGAWLAQQCMSFGLMPRLHWTVPDDRALITRAFIELSREAKVLLVTGGLGPTEDDLTRFGLADALGVDLAEDEQSVEHIRSFFARRQRVMPDRNRVQALCPKGCQMMENPNGTAPGIQGKLNDCDIYIMPGVPREMKAMFADSVRPGISINSSQRTILTRRINTFGLGESDVAERLGDLMARDRNPLVGTTVSGGICAARIRSEAATEAEAKRMLESKIAEVESVLQPLAFGYDEDTLEQAVVAAAMTAKVTVATAESCTGGLIAKYLTDVLGSSDVFKGGWVTYSNEMKTRELGVPVATLEKHGAVSQETVVAMAGGALKRSGADYAIAVTGIAGPDGGTQEKPVGTIWLAIACQMRGEVLPMCLHLAKERMSNRDRTAKCALQALRLLILGHGPEAIAWGDVYPPVGLS